MKLLWALVFSTVFIWSAIEPTDRFTWVLESAPALIGVLAMILTQRTFPLTPLSYLLILIHCTILLVGGHYTYAEVPLFDLLAELTGSARNNYDKLGHFAQGFIPAILAREILIRKEIISRPSWRNFLIVCFCLALSAFYELVEWWVALLTGENAEAFLGTQGYVWDTQSDMALALFGAMCSLLLLNRLHDRQLRRMFGSQIK